MVYTSQIAYRSRPPTTGDDPRKFLKQSISTCCTTEPTQNKNTINICQFGLHQLAAQFGQRDLASVSQEEILACLLSLTKNNRQATERNRLSVPPSFYNFSIHAGVPVTSDVMLPQFRSEHNIPVARVATVLQQGWSTSQSMITSHRL